MQILHSERVKALTAKFSQYKPARYPPKVLRAMDDTLTWINSQYPFLINGDDSDSPDAFRNDETKESTSIKKLIDEFEKSAKWNEIERVVERHVTYARDDIEELLNHIDYNVEAMVDELKKELQKVRKNATKKLPNHMTFIARNEQFSGEKATMDIKVSQKIGANLISEDYLEALFGESYIHYNIQPSGFSLQRRNGKKHIVLGRINLRVSNAKNREQLITFQVLRTLKGKAYMTDLCQQTFLA